MSISTEDMKAQVARVKELRIADSNAAACRKLSGELLEAEENRMLAMLEEADLDNFKCEHGTVGRTIRSSVRIPREPGDLEKLKSYLAERGELDMVFTPNSAKLNSYYKEQLEEAKRLGKDDFEVPGVDGVTITSILRFAKA